VIVTKVLVHLLGMGIYATSTMLACFLFGIGVGSLLCMHLLRRPRSLLYWFALTEAGIGLLGFALPAQFTWIPRLMDYVFSTPVPHPWLAWLTLPAACFAVLLAPTLLMGATLPLLAPVLTPNLRRIGRSVGTLYAVNTLGAVGGVLFTTFLVLPFVGFKTGMIIAGCLNLLVALVALHYNYDISQPLRWRTALSFVIVAILILTVSAPSSLRSVLLSRASRMFDIEKVRFFEEGPSGTVAVLQAKDPRVGFRQVLFINGQHMGGSGVLSLRSFQLPAYLPFFLHQDHSRPKRVLVLAFGMGITTGAIAGQNSQSVTCVELVPEVLKANRFFTHYNHNVLANPKVKVYIEDARNFLLATRQKFDIVVLDATHPRSGDSWMLYTQECYQLVKRVLAPGGTVAQWVPINMLEFQHYLSIIHTFGSVFPHLTLWQPPGSNSTALVGTSGPTRIDFGYLQRRMADPAVHRDFEAAEISDEYALLSYFIAGEERLMKVAEPAPINTDDLSVVQFTKRFVPEEDYRALNQLLTRIKENPLPLLFNLGATPEEAAACAERISRTYKASILVREGYALWDEGHVAQAKSILQKAYELNPHDRDAALSLGLAPRRLTLWLQVGLHCPSPPGVKGMGTFQAPGSVQ